MTVSLINSGMGHPGYSWDASVIDAERQLMRAADDRLNADFAAGTVSFDSLAKSMGYAKQVVTLRRAIDGVATRAGIVSRLSTVIPPYADNLDQLADAYLRDLAAMDIAEAAE